MDILFGTSLIKSLKTRHFAPKLTNRRRVFIFILLYYTSAKNFKNHLSPSSTASKHAIRLSKYFRRGF